jgi:hypothetical protein
MAQLSVFIAGLLLITESQASDVAKADHSTVQGFLSKMEKKQTFNGGFFDSEKFIVASNVKHAPLTSASGKPSIASKEEEKAAQKLLPNGNNTPMTLYAVGVGLFALVMMLRMRIQRGLRPATVLASNGALVSDMSEKMVPGLGDNIFEMKSHASSAINGAALGGGISDSPGSEAHAQYLREAKLKHGNSAMLAALGFQVTPFDPTAGWQAAVFAVDPSSLNEALEWDPVNFLPSDATAGLQPAVFNVANAKFGIFSPAIYAGRILFGNKRLDNIRQEGISLHGQAINEFCLFVGATTKMRGLLIKKAKENGDTLGFLV